MTNLYKVIDGQGTGAMHDRLFTTKDEVRSALASFHSADVENADTLTLDDLLEVGVWELVSYEVDETHECLDCGFTGTRAEFGEDDGGAIVYCPKCESMYITTGTAREVVHNHWGRKFTS